MTVRNVKESSREVRGIIGKCSHIGLLCVTTTIAGRSIGTITHDDRVVRGKLKQANYRTTVLEKVP